MSVESAENIMRAHQYLYYVLCSPVISDAQYDRFCKDNGLDGNLGSDREDDYPPHIVALALALAGDC